MTDEIARRLIKANTRLADASLAIGGVYRDLFVSDEGHEALDERFPDEYLASLESRIFACFQEAMTIAHAIHDIERDRAEWLLSAVPADRHACDAGGTA